MITIKIEAAKPIFDNELMSIFLLLLKSALEIVYRIFDIYVHPIISRFQAEDY